MDPDTTLEMVAQDLRAGATFAAYQDAMNLVEWLDKGGFEPDWAKHPEAAEYVKSLRKQRA